jgi:beta-glucosidase
MPPENPSSGSDSNVPFLWGAATASYQIEGAVAEDGRGPSIWDTFSHTPGKVAGNANGDVACDHYHRYREDVRLLRELGVKAYRFSIAWTRILPEGRGKLNRKGIEFYDRLVDELLASEIIPFATLFHWDLPQALQDKGGFTNRDIAGWFTDYALLTAGRLGDRVRHWIMLNEPSVFACLGHALGVHAPGLSNLADFLAVTHHLNLAQGTALQALRSEKLDWQLGTTLNIHRGVPADSSTETAEMVDRFNAYWNGCFLGPLLKSAYPEEVSEQLASVVQPGDLDIAHQPVDFLGINHYFRAWIKADPESILGLRQIDPPEGLPRTGFNWEINPGEFRDMLISVHQSYPCPPIYITENGAYFEDQVSADGKVHDERRIDFLRGYIEAMEEAVQRGVNIRGYFVWSLLDNFEWAAGYRPTFGLVHMDYSSQQRLPKDSFSWYRDHIAALANS